jgi:tape measure domain-containing protein
MSSVDQRIVEMTFKGDTFLSGVKNALSALLSLKNGLNGLKGSESQLNSLDAAGKKFSLAGIANGVDGIKSKFSAMSVIGISALASVTNAAVGAGINIAKALVVDPIKAGLDSYETKINAIQTILANTESEGTNLAQVTAALNQLNQYANLTVYNFGQMAKNIGTFTAAGVNLKDSVSSIKGIANLAALSGSSAEQASTGMYQLSQAIAAGVVKLQDWNSVVNAGFGGKVFQNALIETARVNGVSVDAMIKKYGSFRQSLQSGWLSAKILTQTLSEFTGDLSKKQLEAMGFTAQESAAIQKQAAVAVASATQVRTVSALFQDLKEEIATAWAAVFQAIIGNITQATSTLSAFHNFAESALTKPIYDLAAILQKFTDLGGRQIVIQSLINVFHALGAILGTVKGAFEAVFPSGGSNSSANALISIAKAVERFTADLVPSKQTLSELKTIFEGFFSVIKIGIDIITGIVSAFTKVGSSAGSAGGGFLSLTAKIAQFVINVKNAIESGGALTKFFQFLGTVISLPVKAIGAIISALTGFSGAAGSAVNVGTSFVSKIGAEFSKLSDAIVNGIKSGDLSKIGTIINQLLLGGVLVSIRKFITGLGQNATGGGLFDSIKESFEGLTNTLKTMQTSLKSDVLLKIAAAVALLTASLVGLSFVNVGNLTKALTAMTVMFTELLGALSVVGKIAGSTGVVKMTVIGVALNELAVAILILSAAVAILSKFSWSELAKGLGAIGVLLTELSVAVKVMSTDTKGLLTAALAMNAIGVALNILALAVRQLGSLDLSTLGKGIGSISALLLVLAGFQKISTGEGLVSTAASMVLIGAALNVMAIAVAKLGALSLDSLVKGIGSVAAVLLVLVVAMNAMKSSLPGAAGLTIAAAGLLILSKAVNSLGAESWGAIGHALVALAGALVILIAAMALMTEALPGAAALLVVSGALALLTPVLVTLGSLSWGSLVKGLAALAGVFLVIGVAAALMTPVVPVLLLLGAGIALIGVGVLAAGAGVLLFATALGALAVAAVATGAAILALIKMLIQLPAIIIGGIANSIATIVKAIGGLLTTVVNTISQIFSAVLDTITKLAPKFAQAANALITAMVHIFTVDGPKVVTAFLNMIQTILTKIATYFPKFAATAIQIVTNMLNAIAGKIPAMAQAAVNLCVAFINAIGKSTVQVVAAAVKMVISMINGIANQIRASTPALDAAMRNLGSAIIGALVGSIEAGLSSVVSAIGHVVSSAINGAKHLLGISSPSKVFLAIGAAVMQGWALGHANNAGLVIDSLTTVGTAAIEALKTTMSGLNDEVNSNLNLQPVITPVIDLTQAKQGFSALSRLSKSQLVTTGTSASTAASISAANAAAAQQAGLIAGVGTSLQFNQYNTSPVALSAIDIYRRTKNQISIAKGVLSGNANTG